MWEKKRRQNVVAFRGFNPLKRPKIGQGVKGNATRSGGHMYWKWDRFSGEAHPPCCPSPNLMYSADCMWECSNRTWFNMVYADDTVALTHWTTTHVLWHWAYHITGTQSLCPWHQHVPSHALAFQPNLLTSQVKQENACVFLTSHIHIICTSVTST